MMKELKITSLLFGVIKHARPLYLILAMIIGGGHSSYTYALNTCQAIIKHPSIIMTNTYYHWGLELKPSGCDIDGKGVEVKGNMPAHAHGLPTTPQIIKVGKEEYIIQGLYFNMMGLWILNVYQGDKLIEQQSLNVVSF